MADLQDIFATAAAPSSRDDDFRSLFATHPAPMWVYDPLTLRFLIVNQAAVCLYGYDPSDYARMTVLDIRPESEHRRMADAIEGRTDIEQAQRWLHLKANGEVFEVVTYGRQVRFEGREAILAIVQDRSELNAAYREASDTRSLLDSIVENLPVGVFVKDMGDDGRYVIFNRASGDIVGRAPSEIIGAGDESTLTGSHVAKFRQQDQLAMRSGNTVTLEETILRPDGAERLVRTVKRALPAPKGQLSRYLLGISEDVTEARAVKAKLEYIAMHDALTDLPNRAYFAERIAQMAEQASLAEPIALLYVDIDHFKHINDSMGHPAGDALLREVAVRLSRLVQVGDIVARLGGDEFAIALPLGNDPARARKFAERLLASLALPFDLDTVREHITCSIGIALAPRDGNDSNVLMRNADLALYAAKAAGRSMFCFYEVGMRLEAERRHNLTVELRRAIDEKQFELHYQPIMSLTSGRLAGFEALIRWRHPERGMVSPADFIPVAEETGLIGPIGEWVLREACMTATGWPDGLRVAVNLSVAQFRHAMLLSTVIAILDETGLAPQRLEIEITESVFLSDSAQSIPLLRDLKALGVRIAIDDFGTGYSSLGYLRSFLFDKIKLDRSFVAEMDDAGNLAIVRAVVGIARGFDAATTAEGIETLEQFERLRAEGFDEAQGYLLGRPVPGAQLPAIIDNWLGEPSQSMSEAPITPRAGL